VAGPAAGQQLRHEHTQVLRTGDHVRPRLPGVARPRGSHAVSGAQLPLQQQVRMFQAAVLQIQCLPKMGTNFLTGPQDDVIYSLSFDNKIHTVSFLINV
jgi:hypothetical protein